MKQNTPEEMIEVIKAFQEGKEIQSALISRGIEAVEDTYKDTAPSWSFGAFNYRIKPVPSEPQPWTMDDVPPVCWVRLENSKRMFLVIVTGESSVEVSDGFLTYKQLAKDYLFSTDLKTWKPCTK